jgi:glutathione synthase
MNILIIADPLGSFKTYKDTTYAIMRAAAARGHTLWACEQRHIFATPLVQATAQRIELLDVAQAADTANVKAGGAAVAIGVGAVLSASPAQDATAPWYTVISTQTRALARFDVVLMRKDPPFDTEYFYATHLLSRAQQQGARVLNSGQALRDHPEKLAILEFPDLAPTTLVSGDAAQIKAFIAEHGDVIVKPLDGMGGTGIFRIKAGDANTNVILETLTALGTQTIMAQRYLPAIVDGDKRVLLIGGEPVPFCLARIPQGGETRGNLAAGGRGEARPLTDSDWRIARSVAAALDGRGLFLVGLDIIGDHLTEINVTSPTCFQEIEQQTGFDVAGMYVEKMLHF